MRDEVAPKWLRRRTRFEAIERCTYPAHVERQTLASAHPSVAILLDRTDQCALRLAAQILQSIQVQRAACGLIERSLGNLAVAFAAKQDRRGIRPETCRHDHVKRLVCASGERVQVARICL